MLKIVRLQALGYAFPTPQGMEIKDVAFYVCASLLSLIAAAACEIHPRALIKGAGLRSTRETLEQASAEAPGSLPAIVLDD